MAGWKDLTSAINATGCFDRAAIMAIALRRARRERDAFAAIGLPQAWAVLLAHELRLTWQVAKTAMDGVIAARLAAALAPSERAARALELRAEIARTAIPPREAEATDLRVQAAAIRAAATGTATIRADAAAQPARPQEAEAASQDIAPIRDAA